MWSEGYAFSNNTTVKQKNYFTAGMTDQFCIT